MLGRGELGPVGAAVCENKGVGCPGVGLAHVKRVRGVRAEFPGGVQAVKFVVLVDSLGGVGIVVCEALVDVAVVDDGLPPAGVRSTCTRWGIGCNI